MGTRAVEPQLLEMVQEFQCPGCVSGPSPCECPSFVYDEGQRRCTGHVLGTSLGIGNHFAIGLPRGFNKPGWVFGEQFSRNTMDIRLFTKGNHFGWDHLNVPVWAIEKDGYLFVRTYSPRINVGYVDIIEGGSMADVPGAIDVSEFINELD